MGSDTWLVTSGHPVCYARFMSLFDQELLHRLGRMPFADTAEMAMITRDLHITVRRALTGPLDGGVLHRNQSLITWLTGTGHR